MRASSVLFAVAMVAVAGTAYGDLDYFVVGSGAQAHVLTYDTVNKNLAFVTSVALNGASNTPTQMFALPNYGFSAAQAGNTAPWEGVEVLSTSDKLSWTSDLRIDIAGETATGEFFDTGVRTTTGYTDPATIGAALLPDGKIFMADSRPQGGNLYYGLTDTTGLSGDKTAIFPSSGLGNLADSTSALTGKMDATSTYFGSADRFVVRDCRSNSQVQVYNSDGTFRGNLTRVATDKRYGIGNFKSTDRGDQILQVDGNQAEYSTLKIDARLVTDTNFGNAIFSFTYAAVGGNTEPRIISTKENDIDGTESGLIMVFGRARIKSGADTGDHDVVLFFETVDGGTTWTPTTTYPLMLKDAVGAPGPLSGDSVAALFLEVPEPATMGLLALGFAGLAVLRRRRR